MSGIHNRYWILSGKRNLKSYDFRFSLCSYNILAQKYVNREIFPYCEAKTLKKHIRLKNLVLVNDNTIVHRPHQESNSSLAIQEIKEVDMDILCLQELELDSQLLEGLKTMGYDGIIKEKTRKGVGEKISFGEGCGIFWKKDIFRLLKKKEVELCELGSQRGNKDLAKLIYYADFCSTGCYYDKMELEKNHVSLNVALIPVAFPDSISILRPILVTTTHLYWHPHFMFTKLLQWKKVYEEALSFRKEIFSQLTEANSDLEKLREGSIPLLVCGDFNVVRESQMFSLFSEHVPALSQLAKSLSEFRTPDSIFDQRKKALSDPAPDRPSFPNAFSSESDRKKKDMERDKEVLSVVESIFELPKLNCVYPKRYCKYTTLTGEFMGSLDHIFVVEDSEIHFSEFLSIPEESTARFQTGLPNIYHGSDHIPVASTFLSRLYF